MKAILFIFVLVVVSSCSSTRKLVYIDEWDGKYTLRKLDKCCDSTMPVHMFITRDATDSYKWKMYFSDGRKADTIYGKAFYVKKRIGFFVENTDRASQFFVNNVNHDHAVFEMEFSNYYTDSVNLHVGHFTKWHNELKGYRAQDKLFAGVHYHFRSDLAKTARIPKKK